MLSDVSAFLPLDLASYSKIIIPPEIVVLVIFSHLHKLSCYQALLPLMWTTRVKSLPLLEGRLPDCQIQPDPTHSQPPQYLAIDETLDYGPPPQSLGIDYTKVQRVPQHIWNGPVGNIPWRTSRSDKRSTSLFMQANSNRSGFKG